MGLYDQRLRKEEIAAMKRLLAALSGDRSTKGLIRSGFRAYAKRSMGKDLSKFVLSRALNSLELISLDCQMVLYDYLFDRLGPAIERGHFEGAVSAAARAALTSFQELGENRISRPWGLRQVGFYSRTVPSVFRNEFFGYRMSANAGSVIRFYIHITDGPDPTEVSFKNVYRRKDIALDIIGTGRFINETLYLVGHATDIGKDDTRGMRLMCLRPVGTKKLCGVLMAEDRGQPIAARALLIPAKQHAAAKNWNSKRLQKSVAEDLDDQSIPEVVEDFLIHALDDIRANTEEPLDLTLARYIDNITPTVLKAGSELTYDPSKLIQELGKIRLRERLPIGPETAQRISESMSGALHAFNERLGVPDHG
jgi:hypothetical protein